MKSSTFWFTLIIVVLTNACPAFSQCSFNWRPPEVTALLSGAVYALATWDPDGTGPDSELLIVGGSFSKTGGIRASNIAAWDGMNWHAIGSGFSGYSSTSCNGTSVKALTVYNGDLIAAGCFNAAGTVTVSGVARWNGVSWEALGASMISNVNALAVFNGMLIAGGSFSIDGGTSYFTVAQWNGSTWQPLGTGLAYAVRAITSYNGNLIAVGDFGVARLNGTVWQIVGGLSGVAFPTARALAVFSGELIAGGSFTTISGVAANNIGRWNGATWQPLGSGLSGCAAQACTHAVHALSVYGGSLYAAGEFSTAGGVSAYNIARWDGANWQPLGASASYAVNALAVHGTEMIVGGGTTFGGSFFKAGGVTYKGVARWNGSIWQPLGMGLNDAVSGFAEYDGDLIAIGWFTSAANASVNTIARWNGTTWRPLDAGVRGGVGVLSVTVYGDELIAGGDFTYAGNNYASLVAAWNGANWHPLGAGTEFNSAGHVYAMTVYNGDLIIGGLFHDPSGDYAIRRWNGTNYDSLGTGLNSTVTALTVYNGELIAGGVFTVAGGVNANRIARWNGTAWYTVGTGTGMDTIVRDLTVYNGELIAVGDFTTADGVAVNHVARWNGANWQALGTGMSGDQGNPSVNFVAVYNDELIASGSFATAGGVSANGIARWNGTSWRAIEGAPISSYFGSLSVYNGELIVASEISIWNRWGPACPRGDMNCDQVVNDTDLPEFVSAVLNPASLTDCTRYLANVSGDIQPNGAPRIDGGDIAAFTTCFVGGPCP